MPITVSGNVDLGITLLVFEGVVTTEEFERLVIPLLDQPQYTLMQSMLLDTTAASKIETPSSTFERLARDVSERVDRKIGSGARMAIVALQPEFFGLARMYQALRDASPVEVEVFRSHAEAEAWLDLPEGYAERLAPPEP